VKPATLNLVKGSAALTVTVVLFLGLLLMVCDDLGLHATTLFLIFIGVVIAAAHVIYWGVLIFGASQILNDLSGRGEKPRKQ
jgi:hypothetical protein